MPRLVVRRRDAARMVGPVLLGGESHRVQFNQRHVLIEGAFSAERRGHRELFSGALEHIARFEVVEPRPGPLVPAPH